MPAEMKLASEPSSSTNPAPISTPDVSPTPKTSSAKDGLTIYEFITNWLENELNCLQNRAGTAYIF